MASADTDLPAASRIIISPPVSRQFAQLRKLAELSERHLRAELDALSAQANEKVSCLPYPDNEFTQGWLDHDLYQLSEVLPKTQRYALLMVTMGAIEHNLHLACAAAEGLFQQRLSETDIGGTGITRSVTYLTKACGLKIERTQTRIKN